jgi:hypothetical protein
MTYGSNVCLLTALESVANSSSILQAPRNTCPLYYLIEIEIVERISSEKAISYPLPGIHTAHSNSYDTLQNNIRSKSGDSKTRNVGRVREELGKLEAWEQVPRWGS